MRTTSVLTTALQLGTFLTAAEAARGRRRAYGGEGDAVQWSAWSATTFQTVTTPAYQSWAATTTKAPQYEEGNEDWNNWEEDDETTTHSRLSIPTQYNPFATTTSKAYNSWEQAPKQYTSQPYNSWEAAPQQYTTTYNSWEHAAKPSPTSFMYQSWVGTAKRYNGDDEDYQGWESTSTKTPEAYQTWTQAYATPTSDAWHTWVSAPAEEYQSWTAAPTTHVISYTTKVVTVEEYASWTEAAAQPTDAYHTWESTSTQAYQTWTEASSTYNHAEPTNVQEWAQWQGQVSGHSNGYGQQGNGNYNGNGNNGYGNGPIGNGPVGIPSLTTSLPAVALPTNAAGGLGGGLGGAGGLGALGGLGGLGGLAGGL